ncbi:hypothetical protein CKAN_02121200 [Cinnamomum micranthum f. kanehirae]|uniref:CASP-like protein n=1 Tax=Cinnamomum micranthum f. kanehirae TaxID=337451 RepID=A0A443PMM7_9MAGN|nr:hypothetical protein CKAN_02121200 [Cinnamomum micranthum f. kanehirae]
MKNMVGSPGTMSGLILRIGQSLFAAASIAFMVSAMGFSSYTAFCYLIASMGLQVLWSFGLACLDVYALKIKRDLQNPVLVSLFVVGDWYDAGDSNTFSCGCLFIGRGDSAVYKGHKLLQGVIHSMRQVSDLRSSGFHYLAAYCHVFPCHVLAFGICLETHRVENIIPVNRETRKYPAFPLMHDSFIKTELLIGGGVRRFQKKSCCFGRSVEEDVIGIATWGFGGEWKSKRGDFVGFE